ncbi:unnamed protein product [Sphagnum jensenii]|uniref:Uncharacterized protein n=1 Tax=Sphagnum jensenii TaxID=128206 RepID=A0ABP0VAH3_9BRYO
MIFDQQTSGAVSIDIRGAKGPNAVTINGVYDPTEEICSGWPVYRKRGDPTKWLEFFVPSNKWYIKATSDRGRARGWMRLSADPAARPELCKSTCEVWDGNKWTSQQSVTIVTAKKRRDEDRKIGAERYSQAVAVDIRGAYGPSATSINGMYEPTSEICGGWPVYRKQGDPDKWLEYIVATNEWYVKPTADRGRAEGWMCLGSDPPSRPELSKGTCEVWDGDRWTIQTTVTVLTAVSGFESLLDVQIFCATQTKELQERLNASLKRAVRNLMNGQNNEKIEEGNRQLDQILADLDATLRKLQNAKDNEESNVVSPDGKATPSGASQSISNVGVTTNKNDRKHNNSNEFKS